MLSVSKLHTLYWEESGSPQGKPVVFLHGGPGKEGGRKEGKEGRREDALLICSSFLFPSPPPSLPPSLRWWYCP